MKDLLEYIVKNLVSKPENVQIDEQRDAGNVNLNLIVDPADMGLIIGKGGQTIHSIRKLLTIRAMAENIRVNLQLSEPASADQSISESENQQEAGNESEATEEADNADTPKTDTPESEEPQAASEASEEPEEKQS